MRCGKVRNMLLTDYTDGCLDQGRRIEVEEHLKKCQACKTYQDTLLDKIVLPLGKVQRLEVPENLWFKVRTQLSAEAQKESNASDSVFSWIFTAAGRHAFVLSCCMVVLVSAAVFGAKMFLPGSQVSVSASCPMDILSPAGEHCMDEEQKYEFGTVIEKSFM